MDRRKPEHLGAGRHGAAFWQEEKENFGTKMMKSMGWAEGKGLGKEEKGQTSFLRAVKKDNALGIGAVKGRDDIFQSANDMYNDLLKRLAEEAKKGSVANERPADEADKDEGFSTTAALKKYEARQGLYGKFKKAKDASNYDNKSMAEIMGVRKTPTPSPSPSPPPSHMLDSSMITTTSKSNIRDYFAKKMGLAGKSAPAPASSGSDSESPSSSPPAHAPTSRFQVAGGQGFSENFQENYYNQMQNMAISGRTGLGLGSSSSAGPNSGAPREESYFDRIKREKREKESKVNTKVKFEEESNGNDDDDWDRPARPTLGLGAKHGGSGSGSGSGMSGFVKSEPPALEAPVKSEVVVKTEKKDDSDSDSDNKKKKKKKSKVKEEGAAVIVVKQEVESDEDKEARLKKEKKAAKKAKKAAEADEAAAAALAATQQADAIAAKKAAKKAAKAAAAAEAEAAAAKAAADAAEADAKAAKKAKKAAKKQAEAEAVATVPTTSDDESSKKKKKRKLDDSTATPAIAIDGDDTTKEKKKKSKKSKSE